VHYGSGTDSGADVYLNGHCRTDFGDIRFTRSDGTTLLDYWMETKVDSDYAIFWVEVADDLSSSNATIYIYYGKSDATTTSNGNDTFIFFDDFNDNSIDTSKWEKKIAGGSSNVYEQNQEIEVYSDGTYRAYLKSIPSFSAPYRLVVLAKRNENVEISIHWDGVIGTWYYRIRNGYTILYNAWDSPTKFMLDRSVNSSATTLSSYNYSLDTSWHRYEILTKTTGTTITAKFNGTTILSTTDTTYTSGYIGLSGREKLGTGAGYVSFYDNIFVAKYVDPEPSHGSWGSEEAYVPSNWVRVLYEDEL
jgi:hypothetical protein